MFFFVLFFVLLCLRVCQMWCVSFIFVKKLVSLSLYRLQCSKKSCSLSALSHYLPSSFCLYALTSAYALCLFFQSLSSLSLSPSSVQLSLFHWHECWMNSVAKALLSLFPFFYPSPSQDKSDLRSSVIQNTDTIWSATHSEYIHSVS